MELAGQSPGADFIQAQEVTVASGARIDVVTQHPGSTVDFSHTYWRDARQWPLLSASSLNGTFSLGAAPVDSSGRPAEPFGTFSLLQETASIVLHWTPASPFQGWLYEHFGDTWNDPLIAGPERDPDGDGWSNQNEWITGSNPNESSSRFTATIGPAGLSFSRSPGRIYRVEMTEDLAADWTFHSFAPEGGGTVTIPLNPGNVPRNFYRIAVSWAP
jgi:hypothetical protein